MSSVKTRAVAAIAALLAFLLLYAPVLRKLAYDWLHDDNYSHGVLIVPLALYFVWERRDRVAAVGTKPSALGLAIVGCGVMVLIAGLLGAELFLARASILITLVGAIVFVAGWPAVRVLAFPLA